MNFKRLRGIAAAAFATLAAAMLAGCMNPMAGSVDGNSNARMATLQLSATGIPEEYAKEFAAYCERQNTSARSILPEDPFDIGGIGSGSGQSDDLVLVLTGKSETGMTYGPEVVGLDTDNTTTNADGKTVYDFNTTIALESMSWNLRLVAYKNYNAATKTGDAVLQGFCSVDLRNGSGTATFVMGIAGLTTKGSVSISGTIVDKSKVAKFYTAGIYRKDNGQDAGTTEEKDVPFDVDADDTFTFTANGNDVPPGTYLYTMIFYNADKEVVGSYVDTIVINPGNKLTKTGLTIDVIGMLPTEPEDLKAYLMDGKQSPDGKTYNVKVTWTQADYATNYELNVVESAGDGSADLAPNGTGLIPNGKIYGMASMDKNGNVEDFPGSAVFGTDSSYMMYGDDSCVLKLETGKVYEIQLRARNYLGTSEWVDRVAGTDATLGTAYAAPATQRINCLLITYNTNGGALKFASTGKTYTNKYAEYKCWTADADLLKIDDVNDPTGNQVTLKKSSTSFAGWLLEDGTAVQSDGTVTTTREDAVEQYTYKNVSVMASFGNKLTGNISQEDKQKDIDLTDITVEYGPASASLTGLSATGGIYKLPKMNSGVSNKIQVSLDNVGTSFANTGTDYTNVKFEVWGQNDTTHTSVSQSSPGVCLVDTARYTEGKMYIMVTADTKTLASASQTLIFELTK